jgi:hypothetical protein
MRRVRHVVVIGVTVALLAGCVGNARTTGAYRGKASHTAGAAISALQTAALAVDTSKKGNILGLYLKTVLSQAEKDFGSVQQQFDSIEPPNTKQADDLRDRLDKLLTSGSDTLSQLRIDARRADQTELEKTAEDIAPLVEKLTEFEQATA